MKINQKWENSVLTHWPWFFFHSISTNRTTFFLFEHAKHIVQKIIASNSPVDREWHHIRMGLLEMLTATLFLWLAFLAFECRIQKRRFGRFLVRIASQRTVDSFVTRQPSWYLGSKLLSNIFFSRTFHTFSTSTTLGPRFLGVLLQLLVVSWFWSKISVIWDIDACWLRWFVISGTVPWTWLLVSWSLLVLFVSLARTHSINRNQTNTGKVGFGTGFFATDRYYKILKLWASSLEVWFFTPNNEKGSRSA